MKTPARSHNHSSPLQLAISLTCVVGSMALAADADKPSQVGSMMTVDYPSLVSRADLDLKGPLGPADSPTPGLPLGNGRLGTLLWMCAPNVLSMQLNHTDVFAFRASSVATRGDHQDYGNVCGRADVFFGEDLFQPDAVRSQLSVHDALGTITAKGVRVRSLAWHARDVIALEITDERAEPKQMVIELAALRPLVQESGAHKAITTLSADGAEIELTQQFLEPKANPLVKDLKSFTAVRARVVGRDGKTEVVGDRVRLTLPPAKGTFLALFAVGQTKDQELADARASAMAGLTEAAASGFDKLHADNGTYWADYWARSFISMTGTQELADMTRFYLWGQYLAGSCLRGNFPPKHSGLIFITQEYRPWGSLFWWFNEGAQQGWQFEANRLELLEPVFRWNNTARPGYESAARQCWNSRGWHIPETSSWDGPELLPDGQHKPEGHRAGVHQSLRGIGFTARNTYNGAKLAALYYKKFLYTGDEAWLKERAYPALRDTAEFYCGLKAGCTYAGGIDYADEGKVILKKDADGKYHLYGTMSHEHIWWGKDIIEDLAAIRGIFPVAIALAKKYNIDADMRAEWQEVLDNLAPYPRSDTPGAIGGLGEGTWCQGLAPHGNIRDNLGDESPRMGPVIGDFLDALTVESDKTGEWQAAMATLDRHPGSNKPQLCSCGEYAIIPARMGRADLVKVALPAQMRSSLEQSRPGASHSLQGPGIFARALHSSLLLSVSPTPVDPPVIRVLDSWPREWDVDFQLLGEGGFLVSSSLRGGKIRFVEILSQLGGECRIRNPWPDAGVDLLVDGGKQGSLKDPLLRFPTGKGKRYLLLAAGAGQPGDLKVAVPATAAASR